MDVTAQPKRSVLVVAAEFPPIKTIGRIRTAKFVEHLRHHGWEPVVLTVAVEPHAGIYDPALEREIPAGVPVYRVPLIDLETALVSRVKRFVSGAAPALASPPSARSPGPAEASGRRPPGFGETLKSWLIGAFKGFLKHIAYVPDNYVFWSRQAANQAAAICRRHHIELVYTSLPPFSACRVGYRLRKQLGIPWIADYRDLWYGDVLREWVGPVRRRFELVLERHYLARADVIIAVSDQKTEFLKKILPRAPARRVTLTNGYDTELYETFLAKPGKPDDTIDFVFTGRLFKNRRGYAFAEALGRLVRVHPALGQRVKVHILGGVAPEIRARYDEILAAYGIGEIFSFPGDIPYHEAMRAQVDADWLLLIVDTGETSDGVIPGKLFEYVAAKRPIFALCDPGATQTIIERGNLGLVVPAESVEQCHRALAAILADNPGKPSYQPDEAYLSQFDRKVLAAELAAVFEETVTNHSSGS